MKQNKLKLSGMFLLALLFSGGAHAVDGVGETSSSSEGTACETTLTPELQKMASQILQEVLSSNVHGTNSASAVGYSGILLADLLHKFRVADSKKEYSLAVLKPVVNFLISQKILSSFQGREINEIRLDSYLYVSGDQKKHAIKFLMNQAREEGRQEGLASCGKSSVGSSIPPPSRATKFPQ